MELTANGNMFYPIVKFFGTWILRKRLAEWTFKFHHNNMECRPYTYCEVTNVPKPKGKCMSYFNDSLMDLYWELI